MSLDREDIEAIAQRLLQLVGHSADLAELVGDVARHRWVSGAWI